jgi:hypothetical protein
MELGFDIYFLIGFGFGSLLMLGLIVYFLREFIIRGDRPAWSARILKSKFSYNGEPTTSAAAPTSAITPPTWQSSSTTN